MASATITSKGQVTIPVEVRNKLGLHPGSRLTFVEAESGGYEIHVEARSIRSLEGAVPAPTRPVSLEEMDEAIAAGAADSAR